ncbi:hypothetical protein CCP1ISM_970004 [Azospirillaceae bacterium]
MKMREVFAGFDQMMGEDFDTMIHNSEQALTAIKKQKKQGEIAKAKQSVVNKQKQLTDLSKKAFE